MKSFSFKMCLDAIQTLTRCWRLMKLNFSLTRESSAELEKNLLSKINAAKKGLVIRWFGLRSNETDLTVLKRGVCSQALLRHWAISFFILSSLSFISLWSPISYCEKVFSIYSSFLYFLSSTSRVLMLKPTTIASLKFLESNLILKSWFLSSGLQMSKN